METILKLEQLSAFYGSRQILHELSLDIPKAGLTAVIGPSGCGKTTLLLCLNGMLREHPGAKMSGKLYLAGEDTDSLAADEWRRRVGLVFQKPEPFPFSIARNISYALRYYGERNPRELARLSEKYLRLAGLWNEVKDQLNKSALELSGGQQQRLCIARALAVEPELLLLDEPASALDIQAMGRLEALLLDMKQHYSLLMVTHNLGQARRLADHVLFMDGGRAVEWGSAEQIFNHPGEKLTRDFLNGIYG